MDIDKEIEQKLESKRWASLKQRRALGYCSRCGKAIYKLDRTGRPYEFCFKCKF